MAADPRAQAEAQLKRVEESIGKTATDVAGEVGRAGLQRHTEVIAFLKSTYGLTHGNANLLAHVVREGLAGGPATSDQLLAAQYAGPKEALLPVYDKLSAVAEGLGTDVVKVVQKTGVSFRRKRQFMLVQAPSAKRLSLGLNLDSTPDDPRIVESSGMCTHTVNVVSIDAVDSDVEAWVRAAYDRAG